MPEVEFDLPPARKAGPDLTPLIDMVFLLLVFFLLTSLSARPAISLDLPEAETAALEEPDDLSIEVARDGQVRVNGAPVAMAELYELLKGALDANPSKAVSLSSDKGTSFGAVVEAMDIARKAGARELMIVTEKKR